MCFVHVHAQIRVHMYSVCMIHIHMIRNDRVTVSYMQGKFAGLPICRVLDITTYSSYVLYSSR